MKLRNYSFFYASAPKRTFFSAWVLFGEHTRCTDNMDFSPLRFSPEQSDDNFGLEQSDIDDFSLGSEGFDFPCENTMSCKLENTFR